MLVFVRIPLKSHSYFTEDSYFLWATCVGVGMQCKWQWVGEGGGLLLCFGWRGIGLWSSRFFSCTILPSSYIHGNPSKPNHFPFLVSVLSMLFKERERLLCCVYWYFCRTNPNQSNPRPSHFHFHLHHRRHSQHRYLLPRALLPQRAPGAPGPLWRSWGGRRWQDWSHTLRWPWSPWSGAYSLWSGRALQLSWGQERLAS